MALIAVKNFVDSDRQRFEQDGFLVVEEIIDSSSVDVLREAFTDVFNGNFATGVMPDEVNWQEGTGDPAVTRQICNGWKANRDIAEVVLSKGLGRAVADLAGWRGARIMIDNVLWKPAGAKSLGYHQDSAFLSWFAPSELLTCWIALDDTTAHGGTVEFARGSHRWALREPAGEFHAPDDYQMPVRNAAHHENTDLDIAYVEVAAGGGSFHHGRTWHGSGKNLSDRPRRSLVLHAMSSDVEYVPENLGEGTGPIYGRYKRLADNTLDENYFPVLWRNDGYRTPQVDVYLNG